MGSIFTSSSKESRIFNYIYVLLVYFILILIASNIYNQLVIQQYKQPRINVALSGEDVNNLEEEGSKTNDKKSEEAVVEKKDDLINTEDPDPWIPSEPLRNNEPKRVPEPSKDVAPSSDEIRGEPENPAEIPKKADIDGNRGSREKGRSGPGFTENGGDKSTEDAVKLGLAWLASVQDNDGKWDSDDFMLHYISDRNKIMDEGPGYSSATIGVTGLSLLAFTGAGNTDTEGEYRNTVSRAKQYLISIQRNDGGFGKTISPDMYAHSIATLAILDLYAASGDKKLAEPSILAMKYLISQQNPGGGWTYAQGTEKTKRDLERNDLSITGWCVLCISAANHLGIEIDKNAIENARKFLTKAVAEDGQGIYADKDPRAWDRGISMTAVSNLCRRLLGESKDSHIQKKQRDLIFKHRSYRDNDKYFWYYCSLAMYKDEKWSEWNKHLKTALVNTQVKSGPRAGSWDLISNWDKAGGRVYTTAMAVLTLEIYYRFEPEYMKGWR